ncbi:hypothetical protein A5727_05700 [Mycobacterium sp. ACS4331]|nr:hypothetical protein A5727_05700 [Mycobacterium sp. ACS4331]
MYDWTYNGPPGTVAEYWSQVRDRLATAGGARLGGLNEVPFEAIFQSVGAALRAKSGPSLATWYSDFFTFDLAHKSSIAPLDEYVGAGETGHWLLASTKSDGAYYGAPHVIEAMGLVINRKLFDRAGVKVEGRFESYEAFIEACDRLVAAGITPIQAGTSDGIGAEGWFMLEKLQVCDSPAELLRVVTGDVPVRDSLYAPVVSNATVLRDKYINAAPNNDTNQDAVNKFLRGGAAMALMLPAAMADPAIGSEFELIGFPASAAKMNREALGAGDTVMIMGYADDKAQAGEVIRFLHQPEQLQLWWELTGSLPADDRFDSSVLPERLKTLWAMITGGARGEYSLWWPDNFYPSTVALPLIGAMQQMFAGAANADQTLTKIDDVFAKFRQQNPGELDVVRAFAKTLETS